MDGAAATDHTDCCLAKTRFKVRVVVNGNQTSNRGSNFMIMYTYICVDMRKNQISNYDTDENKQTKEFVKHETSANTRFYQTRDFMMDDHSRKQHYYLYQR